MPAPGLAGAVHDTVTARDAGVAVTPVGMPGGFWGLVTVTVAVLDGTDVSPALVAVTLTV